MAKTITFALMHFTIAFCVVYAMTGSWLLGGAVALVEPAVNTVAYYFHERLWQRIEYRKLLRRERTSQPMMHA